MDSKLQKQLDLERCVCHDVSYEKICSLIERHNITSIERLQKYVDCADVCGTCNPDIENIIAFVKKNK